MRTTRRTLPRTRRTPPPRTRTGILSKKKFSNGSNPRATRTRPRRRTGSPRSAPSRRRPGPRRVPRTRGGGRRAPARTRAGTRTTREKNNRRTMNRRTNDAAGFAGFLARKPPRGRRVRRRSSFVVRTPRREKAAAAGEKTASPSRPSPPRAGRTPRPFPSAASARRRNALASPRWVRWRTSRGRRSRGTLGARSRGSALVTRRRER